MTSHVSRLAWSLAGGSLAWIAGAGIDALYAKSEGGPSFFDLALHDAGLLAPAAIAVSLGAFASLLLVDPRNTSPRALRRAKALSPLALLAPTAIVLFATLLAQLARVSMTRISASLLSGLAMASGALVLSLLMAALVPALRARLSAIVERSPLRHPVVAIALGALAAAALFAYGIASGTTGGEGGLFGIWGVLKRPELDLRAPSLLGLLALGAAAGPFFAGRRSPLWALAFVLLPLALTIRTATSLAGAPDVVMTLERGAPLGKMALRVMKRAGFDAMPMNAPEEDDAAPLLEEESHTVLTEAVADDEAPSLREKLPKDLNLLLITVDTLRADLGFAGYPKPVSPRLDELASRAVVFERAYSLASYTGKSIGPFLCGKYPSETSRGFSHFNRYPKSDIMVAERLKEAGVKTLGFQAHWYFAPGSGLSRGFDVWDMSAQSGFEVEADTSVTGHKLTDAVLRELAKPEITSSRFFAWAHYLDPHAEYVRHKDAPDFGNGMRAAYDAEVWFTDQQIGRILDFVRQQPWGERTAIIVTSDHGEAFGEHGMIRHGFELWEPLVRVPLLVYVPGIAPKRIQARRSVIDVAPTILDLFHTEPPGEGAAPTDFLSGESLLEDLLLAPNEEPERRDVFIDMPEGPANGERRAFIHDDLKLYISNGGYYQLFDLANDPEEKRDLYRDDEAKVRILPRYRAFKAKLREVVVKAVKKD